MTVKSGPLTTAGLPEKKKKNMDVSKSRDAYKISEAGNSTVKIKDDSSHRDNRKIRDVISNRSARTDRRKVSKSSEDSNIQQGHQQQQQRP
jgi:hypothetical protein